MSDCKHVAIIMDGNGRWAKKQGLKRTEGHKKGADRIFDIVKSASDLGVSHVTLYAFSTENWSRPKPEIDFLMRLLGNFLEKNITDLMENNVVLDIIGDTTAFSKKMQKIIESAKQKTEKNSGINLIIALNYGSKDEIVRACNALVADNKEITEETIESYLDTSKYPNPDLLIRTSGEQRLSNFLLWQMAYAELYFCDTLWPDFTGEDLSAAVTNYNKRTRRYGAVLEG